MWIKGHREERLDPSLNFTAGFCQTGKDILQTRIYSPLPHSLTARQIPRKEERHFQACVGQKKMQRKWEGREGHKERIIIDDHPGRQVWGRDQRLLWNLCLKNIYSSFFSFFSFFPFDSFSSFWSAEGKEVWKVLLLLPALLLFPLIWGKTLIFSRISSSCQSFLSLLWLREREKLKEKKETTLERSRSWLKTRWRWHWAIRRGEGIQSEKCSLSISLLMLF